MQFSQLLLRRARFFPVITVMMIACAAVLYTGNQSNLLAQENSTPTYDTAPAKMEWVEPGLVIDKGPPKGWTHLVFVSQPRIAAGDVDALPSFAAKLAGTFSLTCLANAKQQSDGEWRLDKVGIGMGVQKNGKTLIISADSADDLGVNLGFLESQILSGQEKSVNKKDVVRLVRSSNLFVFDAKTMLRWRGRHQLMMTRHAIIVSPKNGGMGCLVWLLDPDNGGYQLASDKMRLLKPNLIEDRKLYVDGSKINLVGIPKQDAIAVIDLPPGKEISFTPELRQVAAEKEYTQATARQLEKGIWDALSKK